MLSISCCLVSKPSHAHQYTRIHTHTRTQAETGYRVEVATLRRLEFENDAFAFGDKLIERWYPSEADGSNKASQPARSGSWWEGRCGGRRSTSGGAGEEGGGKGLVEVVSGGAG